MLQELHQLLLALWRFCCWFVLGCGLESLEEGAESGIGHAISLMGIVLGGTVTLGVAIHGTGTERLNYLWLYGAAGFMALGAMTSILRGSTSKTRETVNRIWRGEGKDVKHVYNHYTISFTRWTLLGSTLFVAVGIGLACKGWFPGQELPKRFFPVQNVRRLTSGEEKDIGSVGVVAEVPINRSLYHAGIPSCLRLRITLAASLAKEWNFFQEPKLWRRSFPAEKYELAIPGACWVDTGNHESQCVDLLELGQSERYCLNISALSGNCFRLGGQRHEAFGQIDYFSWEQPRVGNRR